MSNRFPKAATDRDVLEAIDLVLLAGYGFDITTSSEPVSVHSVYGMSQATRGRASCSVAFNLPDETFEDPLRIPVIEALNLLCAEGLIDATQDQARQSTRIRSDHPKVTSRLRDLFDPELGYCRRGDFFTSAPTPAGTRRVKSAEALRKEKYIEEALF